MVKLQRRPFGEPDNVREVPLGHLETYDMGEIRIGRSILQPGWRWSESIKPITRTELCEYHHIGVCLSGRMRIQTREGAELTVDAGQFYEIPAGHEAWVEGDEPYVNIEWQPSVAFGGSGGRRLRPDRRHAARDRHRELDRPRARARRRRLA